MKIYEYKELNSIPAKEECVLNLGSAWYALGDILSVLAFKEAHPNIKLLLNTKLNEEDYVEAKMAFDIGADIVSVQGTVSDKALCDLQLIAEENQGQLLLDVRNTPNTKQLAENASILGVNYVMGTECDGMISLSKSISNYALETTSLTEVI